MCGYLDRKPNLVGSLAAMIFNCSAIDVNFELARKTFVTILISSKSARPIQQDQITGLESQVLIIREMISMLYALCPLTYCTRKGAPSAPSFIPSISMVTSTSSPTALPPFFGSRP